MTFARVHTVATKGRLRSQKWMNFRKTSKRGGGVISDPKIFVADFSIINEHFLVILRGKTMNFRKKKRGVTPMGRTQKKIRYYLG